MNEYIIDFFIESDEDETLVALDINSDNKKEWKEKMEAIALSQYYKRKIIVSEQKI